MTRAHPGPVKPSGFTLLEMMIALAVLVVLTIIGVPSFRNFTVDQEIKNNAQALYSTLVYARSEALKRNTQVYVFPNGGGWENGWLVSTDAAVATADCSDTSNETGVLQANCTIANSRVKFASGSPAQVTFRPSGRAQAARFVLCTQGSNAHARSVRVELGGLPLIERGGQCS